MKGWPSCMHTSPPRNVLVIMTDQHRIDTINALLERPSRAVHTPNIDRLATSGFAFTEAFTPTAICTPARASLLTGQAPFRHKVLANHEWNIAYQTELPTESWTYTRALRDAGYNVGLVGKFHVGEEHTPAHFGMDDDSFVGAINPVGDPRYTAWLDSRGFPGVQVEEPVRGTLPGNRPGHVLAARLKQPREATFEAYLTELALNRLKQYADDWHGSKRPFCLHLHYFGPHLPYFIPDEYYDLIDPDDVVLPGSFHETFANKPQVQRNYATYWSTGSFSQQQWRKIIAIYRGYVALIDHFVGEVMAGLEGLNLTEDTSVFFTADHGEFTGAHRLNDKGPAAYDDILKVPFLVRVPGCAHEGQSDALVSLLDLPATILDLAGLEAEEVLDGRSLLDLDPRRNAAPWRDDLVCEFHGHHFPLQQRILITHHHKLVVSPESLNELYDRVEDPHELVNRYEDPDYEEIRLVLTRRLHHLLQQRGDRAFANWMLATTDFDVPMMAISHSDYDDVTGAG